MKSGCDRAGRHRMTAREWLLVVAASLLLHLLLFVLFRPLPHQNIEHSSGARYTLYMEETKVDSLPEDPLELRYWLRYTDPEQVLKPDRAEGFSMFCGRPEIRIPDPQQFRHDLFRTLSPFRFPAEKPEPVRQPGDFAFGAGTPVLQHGMSKPEPPTVGRYPVWTDDTGRVFCGLFMEDVDSVQLMKREKSSGTTLLRLTSAPDFPASVVVRRSCGNPKLDRLAVRQLTAHTAGLQEKAPRTRYFKVIWERPVTESIRKEVRR